jgi:hypothetical protein
MYSSLHFICGYWLHLALCWGLGFRGTPGSMSVEIGLPTTAPDGPYLWGLGLCRGLTVGHYCGDSVGAGGSQWRSLVGTRFVPRARRTLVGTRFVPGAHSGALLWGLGFCRGLTVAQICCEHVVAMPANVPMSFVRHRQERTQLPATSSQERVGCLAWFALGAAVASKDL